MRTRKVGPTGWRVYLGKGEEFSRLMRDAAARGDWNAVGLGAVHTVISAADALTSFHLGERSGSQDHGESIDLIRGLVLQGADDKANQAAQVLDAKNLVEYEARDFGASEAQAVRKKAERFLTWVRESLRQQ